jgi:hypothetical protein
MISFFAAPTTLPKAATDLAVPLTPALTGLVRTDQDARQLLDAVLEGASARQSGAALEQASLKPFMDSLYQLAERDGIPLDLVHRELSLRLSADWRVQMQSLRDMGQPTTVNDIYVTCANMTRECLGANFPDSEFSTRLVEETSRHCGGAIVSYHENDPAIKYRVVEKKRKPWRPFRSTRPILDIEILRRGLPVTKHEAASRSSNPKETPTIQFTLFDPTKLAALCPLINQLRETFEGTAEIAIKYSLPTEI